ncbi:MAG TPA: signal peptidase I [Clostridiaceae bacterium]|nr:signal peptidase I [Clostridiaceae bacterium]
MKVKIIKIADSILYAVLLIILFMSLAFFLYSSINPENSHSMFGYRFLAVLSGSMHPVLDAGDLIIVKGKANGSIDIGDIITYKSQNNGMITHRVVDVIKNGNGLFYRTKGDSNNIADDENIKPEQITGTLAYKIPYAGYVTRFVKSRAGILLLIILPSTLLFIFKTIDFIGSLTEYKKNRLKSAVK